MIKILSGTASQDFAERVAKAYGTELVPVTTTRFSDGEFTVSIEETVRGTVSEVLTHFENKDPKGEFVIVLEGKR